MPSIAKFLGYWVMLFVLVILTAWYFVATYGGIDPFRSPSEYVSTGKFVLGCAIVSLIFNIVIQASLAAGKRPSGPSSLAGTKVPGANDRSSNGLIDPNWT